MRPIVLDESTLDIGNYSSYDALIEYHKTFIKYENSKCLFNIKINVYTR